jgi:hypothetical protein
MLVHIVMGAPPEDLDYLVTIVDKISDSWAQRQLLNWLYFERSTELIQQKQFAQARTLAARMDEIGPTRFSLFPNCRGNVETE